MNLRLGKNSNSAPSIAAVPVRARSMAPRPDWAATVNRSGNRTASSKTLGSVSVGMQFGSTVAKKFDARSIWGKLLGKTGNDFLSHTPPRIQEKGGRGAHLGVAALGVSQTANITGPAAEIPTSRAPVGHEMEIFTKAPNGSPADRRYRKTCEN